MTLNDTIRAGWIEYMCECPAMDLLVSVPPEADLDGIVLAFDHEEREMIRVNGWLWNWERVA